MGTTFCHELCTNAICSGVMIRRVRDGRETEHRRGQRANASYVPFNGVRKNRTDPDIEQLDLSRPVRPVSRVHLYRSPFSGSPSLSESRDHSGIGPHEIDLRPEPGGVAAADRDGPALASADAHRVPVVLYLFRTLRPHDADGSRNASYSWNPDSRSWYVAARTKSDFVDRHPP